MLDRDYAHQDRHPDTIDQDVSDLIDTHLVQTLVLAAYRLRHPEHVDAYYTCKVGNFSQRAMAKRLKCAESTLSDRFQKIEIDCQGLMKQEVRVLGELFSRIEASLTQKRMQPEALSLCEFEASALNMLERYTQALSQDFAAVQRVLKPTPEFKKLWAKKSADDQLVMVDIKPLLREGAAANLFGSHAVSEHCYQQAMSKIDDFSEAAFLTAERARSLTHANVAYLHLSWWLSEPAGNSLHLERAVAAANASLAGGLVVPTAVLNAALTFFMAESTFQSRVDQVSRAITIGLQRGVSPRAIKALFAKDRDLTSPAFIGMPAVLAAAYDDSGLGHR